MSGLYRIGSFLALAVGGYECIFGTWSDGTLLMILALVAAERADTIDVRECLK